jgi:hypothetical protein
VSDEDTPQIPVDAPQPDAEDRVEIVSPVSEPEPEPVPTASAPPVDDFVAQHPEALVAGAFAGAFLFAKFLQRIGGNR